MKFDRMKCKQTVLRFNCHNKFPFFRKGSAIYLFIIFFKAGVNLNGIFAPLKAGVHLNLNEV